MEAFEDKAEAAERSGDLSSARQLWRELAFTHQDPVYFCRYGQVAQELREWDEAENAFVNALQLDPRFPPALEGLGALYLTRTDRDETPSLHAAKEWFLKALRYGRNARVLTFLGSTLRVLGEAPSSRKALEEALQIDPNYEEALYNLALLEKGEAPTKASELLERAISVDPNYALAHRELGILNQKSNLMQSAEYHLRRTLEIDPTDYWAHLYLANLLGMQGKNAEAEQLFRFATALHPEMVGGKQLFARFLESIGKTKEARELLDAGQK